MITNTLGDLRVLRAEMDARYGQLSGHERPTSSLTIIARVMRRQRWAEEHPGRVR
jgi:hypothetical protein